MKTSLQECPRAAVNSLTSRVMTKEKSVKMACNDHEETIRTTKFCEKKYKINSSTMPSCLFALEYQIFGT